MIESTITLAAREEMPVSEQDAGFIRSILASDRTIEAGLIQAMLCSPDFAAAPSCFTNILVGVIPNLIHALLDPATHAGPSLSPSAVSMLVHVPESHRTAVVETAIAALAAPAPSVVTAIATRVISSKAAEWKQEEAICNAALDGKTTAPLAALLSSLSVESVIKALISRCGTGTGPSPVGFDRTVDLLVSVPFLFEAPLMHISTQAASSAGPCPAQTLLYAIVSRKPRSVKQILLFLVRSGNTAVLEQVLSRTRLCDSEEGEMSEAIKVACAALQARTLCLLARANVTLFAQCATSQYLAHEFVRLGGNIGELFDGLTGLHGLHGRLSEQLDSTGMPLIDTAARCENWRSVPHVRGTGPGVLESMRNRRPLAKQTITKEAAHALIDLFAAVAPAANKATAIMGAVGLSAFVLRLHDLETLRYAASKCGCSAPDLVIAATLVEGAVSKKLYALANSLVDLLASDNAVGRIVGKYEIFASAPDYIVTKVWEGIQAEGARALAYARAFNGHLLRVVEFANRECLVPGPMEQRVTSVQQSAMAEAEQLECNMSCQRIIEQVAANIARVIRDASVSDELPAAIDRLVLLLHLGGNPGASIARVYANTKSAFFFTAFLDERIWKHAVLARRYKDGYDATIDDLFAQWLKYRQLFYDKNESAVAVAATFEGPVIARTALADEARALPALLRIADFITANMYPHPEYCTGRGRSLLGSEVNATIEPDTATGQGAQSDLLFTLYCTCTGLREAKGPLALFDLYKSGLVPRPDADRKLLKLFGWVIGSMFVSNVPTGTPCLSPVISAMLLGIHVPNFTDALNLAQKVNWPAGSTFDVDMSLTLIGHTASHCTEDQVAAVSARFKEATGSEIVTAATFGELVKIAQPLFRSMLDGAIAAIATGFRAAIVGGSDSVPPLLEIQTFASAGAILGTPQAPCFGGTVTMHATEADLTRIASFTAGACAIDLAAIRASTDYGHLLSDQHPAVVALWGALALLSATELEEFYIFWTSAPAPRTGIRSIDYRIVGKECNANTLLVSHTCYKGLDLSTSLTTVAMASACIKNTMANDRISRSMHR